jgi:hypothetical protein
MRTRTWLCLLTGVAMGATILPGEAKASWPHDAANGNVLLCASK